MGDRFYEQQAGSSRAQAKPKRKLKADWVSDIQSMLNTQTLSGLDKATVVTLEALHKSITKLIGESNAKDI